MQIEEKPLGRRNYEQFATRYAEHAGRKAENAMCERPAMLSLIPELKGKRVLDAGCGPGHYADELINRGASVIGCDVTPEMVALARALVGHKGADIREHDLDKPLTWLDDGSVDLVFCALALDYVADLGRTFSEFRRVLRPCGKLLFSVEHPINTARLHGGPYHETRLVGMQWKSFGEPRPYVQMYRRPLQEIVNPLIAAGFILEQLVEPRPTEDLRVADPKKYERLLQTPYFVCIRAKCA